MKTKPSKTKRKARSAAIGPKPSKVISFRPVAEDLDALIERADEEGKSRHQMAHKIVVQSLHQAEENQELMQELDALRRQVSEIKKDLSLVAEVLLAHAGKVAPKEAAAWVDENLTAQ